jgi:hypothetical protein
MKLETTFHVVGHYKLSYYKRGVESFALCPVMEFWVGFLPFFAHSTDITKDNFKLRRMM